jgi:hypothetical protein
VDEILAEGNRRMQAEAAETMALVRDAMGLYGQRHRAVRPSGADSPFLASVSRLIFC